MSNNSIRFYIAASKGLSVSDFVQIFEYPQKKNLKPISFHGRGEVDVVKGINEFVKSEVNRKSQHFFGVSYEWYFDLSVVEEKDYIKFIFDVTGGGLSKPLTSTEANSGEIFADFIVDFFVYICSVLGKKCLYGFGDVEFVLEAHRNSYIDGLGKYWLNYIHKGTVVDGYFPSRGVPSPLPWFKKITLTYGQVLVGERYPLLDI